MVALTTIAMVADRANATGWAKGLISGKVLSGDIPIAGATVALHGAVLVPGESATVGSIAVAKTLTDSRGNFSIDLSKARFELPRSVSTYKNGRWYYETVMVREEPSNPQSAYLIATGGNAGGGANPAIKLMLTLGDLTGLHRVTINEITTVAAAFVCARNYRRDYPGPTDEGPGPYLFNGASMARVLVDPENGTLRPIFRAGMNTPALVNTLADIVAACVRSKGQNSRACTSLFDAAPPVARPRAPGQPTEPANTWTALENVALRPQHNPAGLFAILPLNPPYVPVLRSAPRAFMITLNFTRGGLRHPAGITFDPDSNSIWIANVGGDSVTELGANAKNFGKPLSGPRGITGGGLRAPTAIRYVSILPPEPVYVPGRFQPPSLPIPSLWVTNRGDDSLTEIIFSPRGHTGPPRLKRITGNGLNAPVDLVEIDGGISSNVGGQMLPYQFVAVANSGANVISLFKPFDTSPCGPPVRIADLKRAAGIGFAVSGIWVADAASNALFAIKPPDVTCAHAEVLGRVAGTNLNAPRFITWESQSDSAAVTNAGSSSVGAFTHASTDHGDPFMARELAGSPFTGGGLKGPAGVAIDGDGNAWVANYAPGANSISEIACITRYANASEVGVPLSPKNGFTGAGLNRPFGIAIDHNGNLWVTNRGGDSVTVFIGVARTTEYLNLDVCGPDQVLSR